MPIYSYRCDNCGHQQDVLQKMSDPLLVLCPACQQSTYRKQVTAAGFQLKGSGWYVTDFRNPAAKSAAKASSASSDSAVEGAVSKEGSATPKASAAPAKPAAAGESKGSGETAATKAPAAASGSGGTGGAN